MYSKRSFFMFSLFLVTGTLLSISIQKLLIAQPILSPDRPELLKPLDLPKNSLKFPGNKNLPQLNFLTKEQFLPTLNKKAVLKSFELMTFGEYVASTPYADLPPDVSPDRMVIVIKAEFSKGLEADNADYSSATVTSVRDALTKEPFTYSITGEVIRQKGVGATIEPSKAGPKIVRPSFCSESINNTKLECN